jgi:protease IV
MTKRRALYALLGVGALVVLLGLGVLLSLVLVPTPQVALVRVQGDIVGDYTAAISQALRDLAADRAVRAVVLQVSSPGGEVTASESMYLDVLALRETKPVIVSVDEMAASGAYYLASAADRIFAKPASMVGNIGVISILPAPDLVNEQLITTGPFKLSGGPEAEYVRQMELMKNTFLASILAQRADRLTVGTDVLSRGEIYPGLQAQQLGLIDQVGSHGDAVAAAAQMARLRHYEVVDRTPQLSEEAVPPENPEGISTSATVARPSGDLPPGFYYRYVEPPQ